MSRPLLIAQITDLHLGPEAISAPNAARLERVVARLVEIEPDVVLATGDLTDGGATASYVALKSLLAPLTARLLPAVGNHDRREGFVSVFPEFAAPDGFVQHVWSSRGRRILVLDTLEPGQHGGGYCDRRAAWLRARLAEAPGVPTLIALHHPPVRSGIQWMDHGVEGAWADRLDAILRGKSQVAGLVSGHLHRAVSTTFAGRPLSVAPSVAPGLALDLSDLNATRPDGRPLIVNSTPGFALHFWSDEGLVSHFGVADEGDVLARFDDSTETMIRALTMESRR